jgi:hypothetical protein
MSKSEIKNAVIESASLNMNDGFLTVWLTLDYGGTGQGFGGYTLYLPKDWRHHNPAGPNCAGHFIARVLEIADVREWDRLQHRTIRVRTCDGLIEAIGHIVKDDWFCAHEDFDKMRAAARDAA